MILFRGGLELFWTTVTYPKRLQELRYCWGGDSVMATMTTYHVICHVTYFLVYSLNEYIISAHLELSFPLYT